MSLESYYCDMAIRGSPGALGEQNGSAAHLLDVTRDGNTSLQRTSRIPLNGTPYRESMPRICEFYGIVILMDYLEHSPPHFHARYAKVNVR